VGAARAAAGELAPGERGSRRPEQAHGGVRSRAQALGGGGAQLRQALAWAGAGRAARAAPERSVGMDLKRAHGREQAVLECDGWSCGSCWSGRPRES
jgi:hypothetical protein